MNELKSQLRLILGVDDEQLSFLFPQLYRQDRANSIRLMNYPEMATDELDRQNEKDAQECKW